MKHIDRPPTLVAAAATSIRDEIVNGVLLPGTPLHEVELANTLDISRGSVREALRLLQQEGLVEIIPYRGAFVARLTPERVKEIYTLRALLEPYAVRLAMENHAFSDEDQEELKTLVERMSELEQRGNYAGMIETDIQFHETTSKYCDHSLLMDVLLNLQSLTLMFILNTKLYQSDMVPDDVSHRSILEGILSGDPDTAEQVVRQHIVDAGSSLLNRMEEIDWEKEYLTYK
jgi:DNA-binding GntR family transcriptional regulator